MHRSMDLSQYEAMYKWPKAQDFFPHLVTTLCKKVGVLMEANDQFMRVTKNLIGHYLEAWENETGRNVATQSVNVAT
ncbi:hypothetical protein Gotur_006230 [Gossypium turneri]